MQTNFLDLQEHIKMGQLTIVTFNNTEIFLAFSKKVLAKPESYLDYYCKCPKLAQYIYISKKIIPILTATVSQIYDTNVYQGSLLNLGDEDWIYQAYNTGRTFVQAATPFYILNNTLIEPGEFMHELTIDVNTNKIIREHSGFFNMKSEHYCLVPDSRICTTCETNVDYIEFLKQDTNIELVQMTNKKSVVYYILPKKKSALKEAKVFKKYKDGHVVVGFEYCGKKLLPYYSDEDLDCAREALVNNIKKTNELLQKRFDSLFEGKDNVFQLVELGKGAPAYSVTKDYIKCFEVTEGDSHIVGYLAYKKIRNSERPFFIVVPNKYKKHFIGKDAKNIQYIRNTYKLNIIVRTPEEKLQYIKSKQK